MVEMIQMYNGLLVLAVSAGWWAHVIYAGRAERRHEKTDKARRYWKEKYHKAIAERNELRRSRPKA